MKFKKTNRSFTKLRQYGFLFTLLIAFLGLFVPKIGLLVIFIMIGLTVTSLFNGRYWCGNICPHGSLFDNIFLPISKNKKIPDFIKSKTFIFLFFSFFMFNFTRKMTKAFSFWGNYDFLDKLGLVFVTTYLFVIIAGGLLAVFITPRTWCQFCPMGSMQKVSDKIGTKLKINTNTKKRVTISDIDKCKQCGLCSKVCPIQLTPHKNFDASGVFQDDNCIKCNTCVVNCPFNLLEIK